MRSFLRLSRWIFWLSLLAAFLPAGALQGRLVIVEIHYHPAASPAGPEALEFVEIYNDEPLPFDITGYRLADGIELRFPPGTVIPGEGVIVAARNPAALAAAHGIPQPLGPYSGSLDNGGETIELIDAGGSAACRVRYDDRGRWPAAADGGGPSLVLRDPLLRIDDPASWGASRKAGGTPGSVSFETAAPALLLNEVFRDGRGGGWVEIFNPGRRDGMLLSGYRILGDAEGLRSFEFPSGAPGPLAPPRGFLRITEAELGFSLDPADLWLALQAPGGGPIEDARRLEAAAPGASDGRHPDGGESWLRLSAPSPASSNIRPPVPPIVLDEIHYHPLSGDADDEFIELLNTGLQPMNLGGFAFTSGIQFTFPEGSAIGPGERLVLARDPARIEAAYGLSGVSGPFTGVLADGGENIRLRDLLGNPVFDIRYFEDGSWPRWADGSGPSLELVDPRQDGSLGAAWMESDEGARSSWASYEYTGRQKSGDSELHLYLLGAGEALVDDIEVLPEGGGNNLIPDGNFNGADPLRRWVVDGTHVDSRIEPGAGPDGSPALHIIASRRGDSLVNRIERQTTPALAPGAAYTVRFKARWLKGSALLMTRSWNHGLARVHRLEVPAAGGTPGRPGSRSLANTGPLLDGVEQAPILPQPGEPVVVRARIRDADGVASAVLFHRLDGEPEFRQAEMRDDGLEPDAIAGDGIFAAAIPAEGAARSVGEYTIEARDGAGAARAWPPGAPAESFLYQYDDGIPAHAVPAYRVVLREKELRTLQARSPLSNHHLPAALVYRRERIFHPTALRYRGSPYLRDPGVTGLRKGIRLRLPEEDSLRGLVRITLDEQAIDPAVQVDRVVRHLLQKAGGIPYGERRHAHVILRGASLGTYEEVMTVDPHYLERSFGDAGSEGELYKLDAHYEIQDDGVSFPFPQFTSWKYTAEKEDLRFTYKKRNRIGEDDYSGLISLLDLMDAGRTDDAEFERRAPELIDADLWIKSIAVYRAVEDWDAVGGWTGKNDYLYRHPDGRWRLIPWDHDVAFGSAALQGDQNPQAYLYTPYFAEIRRLLQLPVFDRRFNAELLRLLREDYDRAVLDPVLDSVYNLLKTTSGAAAPNRMKTFIAARRTYLLSKVSDIPAFIIETGGGLPFTTAETPAVLRGKAPFAVREIFLGGEPAAVRWVDRATWEIRAPLERGVNPVTLIALDGEGGFLASAGVEVTLEMPAGHFLRGDANGDLQLNITDAVRLLLHLFAGRPAPCVDAIDADDSGAVDTTDAIYLLSYLFMGGNPPPEPFPGTGADPTADGLECGV